MILNIKLNYRDKPFIASKNDTNLSLRKWCLMYLCNACILISPCSTVHVLFNQNYNQMYWTIGWIVKINNRNIIHIICCLRHINVLSNNSR